MIKSIQQMNGALNNAKPFSAISVWFDKLTSKEFKEDDYDGIPELTEAINLQGGGPTEAARCVRKQLKYGSVHGQKRTLTILAALVENAGPRFQTTFADERLITQIKLTAADPLVDASVRRKLMRLLLSWQRQYSSEPTLRTISSLYAACGGGREKQEREAQKKRSEAEELLKKQDENRKREMQVRMDRKTAEKLQKEEDKKRSKMGKKARTAPKRFNYEAEKPMILNHLAVSSQSATGLVNALQHVNREKENVSANARVVQLLGDVKSERKIIVRYIQLCQEEDMLGALIEANDRIMVALQLYDKLSKPVTSDSEDEDVLLASVESNRPTAAQRAIAEDAEIEAVRQSLAASDFHSGKGVSLKKQRGTQVDDEWEGEIEKLQFRQKMGINRHNSRRGESGEAGAGAMQDLLDLDFDETSNTSGPSLTSGMASTSTHSGGGSGGGTVSGAQHGSLSDYSDYDDSSDEDRPPEAAGARFAGGSSSLAPPTASEWSSTSPLSPAHSGSTTQSQHGAALEAWRSSHKSRIGEETSSLWSKEDEERWIEGGGGLQEDQEEEEDPFGDENEWQEVAAKLRASGAEPGRREWATV